MLAEILSARLWWVFAVRGMAAVLFGLIAIAWSGVTLAALVLLWGTYALLDGLLAIVAAVRAPDGRWWLVAQSVAGICAGIMTFLRPDLAQLALMYIIGAWALLTGILHIVGAFSLRKVIDNEWWLAISGLVSLLFGLRAVIDPDGGGLALLWMIASYAIVFGLLFIALALRLYSLAQHVDRRAGLRSSHP